MKKLLKICTIRRLIALSLLLLALTHTPAFAETAPPTVTITPNLTADSDGNFAVNGNFDITITFSAPVTGFAARDIDVTGGTAGTPTTVDLTDGAAATYTATITPTAQGVITINIAAGMAMAGIGNGNTASNQLMVTYDSIAPMVMPITAPGFVTDAMPFNITLTFDDQVNGFTASDINLSGVSANLSNFNAMPGDQIYTATITPEDAGMDMVGMIIINIAAGVAMDTAGNMTPAVRHIVQYRDTTRPMVESITAGAFDSGSFPVTITFSEAVAGLTEAEITVTSGTAVSLTGSGTTYMAMISPNDLTMTAMLMINIAENTVMDLAGNDNMATTTIVTYTPETTAPTVTSIVPSGNGVTGSGANFNVPGEFTVTITFSEAVTGFDMGDIMLGGVSATLSNFDGSGTEYTATIMPGDMNGAITLTINVDVAMDLAGNDNEAATPITVMYMQNDAPTATATSSATDMTVMEGATVTLTGVGMDMDVGDQPGITYRWTQTEPTESTSGAGIALSLSGDNDEIATFTVPSGLPKAGINLVFRLTVTSNGQTDTDDVTVMVVGENMPPTANAGMDLTDDAAPSEVDNTLTISLDGSGNDPDGDNGDLSFEWTVEGNMHGTFNNNTLAKPIYTITNLPLTLAGMLIFTLKVTEMGADGLSGTDTVTVMFTANGTNVVVSEDQKVRAGVPIMLSGYVTDPDALINDVNLEWTTMVDDVAITLNHSEDLTDTRRTANATYTPTLLVPIGTVLTFRLTATGGSTPNVYAEVIITIGSPQEQTVTIVAEIARAFMSSTVTAISNRLLNAKSGAQVNTAAASWNENSDKTFFSARALSRLAHSGDAQSMKAMLGKSDFQMPFGDAGRSAGDIALWGSGAYSDLSGESDKVQWDGKLSGFHIGIDRRIKRDSGGDALLGIALSSLSSEVDYSDGTNVDVLASGTDPDEQGNYEIDMTTLSPYIGWNRGDVELWASAGFGMGEVQRNIGGAQPISIASDAQQLTAAFGGNGALFIDGSFDLRLKGELSASQFKLDGSADDIFIAGQTLDATRARIGLYSNHLHKIGVGRKITSTNEIGIRFDGGDGITGSGTEIGGKLRYANSVSGLVVEGSARGLLGHNGDFNEWGIQGSVAKQNGRDGQGLAFYLTPVYGDVNSGVAELLASGLSGEVDNSAARDYHINLNTRLGYGIAYWGMVTPYSEMVFGARDELRMGVNWKLNSTFNLTLVGEEADVDSVRLLGEVNF